MSEKPVTIDHPDARPPIELVHKSLSTGETIVYHPDFDTEEDFTEWIRSDYFIALETDQ